MDRYTKPRGQQPDYSSPVVLRRSKCTVEDFCNAIHKEIVKQFRTGKLALGAAFNQLRKTDSQRWCGVLQQSTREGRRLGWSMCWKTRSECPHHYCLIMTVRVASLTPVSSVSTRNNRIDEVPLYTMHTQHPAMIQSYHMKLRHEGQPYPRCEDAEADSSLSFLNGSGSR